MINFQEINSIVIDKKLSGQEQEVLNYFDNIITDKIKQNFVHSDKMYIGDVIFEDYFKAKRIPYKRQSIIIEHLVELADKAGWKLELEQNSGHDDMCYYVITPKKK